ncbi:tetratricopeptide repeat protein [Paludibacter sp. 221]|uniref:type IX secretion system periplasmic lipoprotein PorW/SprE n=1 Tax=Paludibacter sp. 221 TaxID=2302939 RepID=UPI0013D016EF|nr:tetratricopeptide repeat protein [Paludibacter sp. 221]NDV46511.1 tetratricopeptide repeat protein [Paludibacter sp. 221]
MDKKIKVLFSISLLLFLFYGCSTKKNTWLTRNFHSMTTKYNVAFNGSESYNEGLKNILSANQDDYSTIIPMYPISRHSNATAGTSNMDKTIEKSRKAIKLHSIKVKPKRDLKKWNDPEYQAFYNQNEFNPALKEAWMMIGKAEFHKADFLGSVGTFSYISKYYSADKDLVAQCQLWMVRAYVEMDWIYEAEQMLEKVNQDDLRSTSIGLSASANAVLLLKKGQYKDAIPFVELSLSRERDKAMKQRFTFLLAQLYEQTGDKQAATKAYSDVIKMNPPYTMDFNARISKAQLVSGSDKEKVLKDLRKMAKNANNKEYLDQIYYAIGNIYLHDGDTARAIENYDLSVESSTRKGVEKAVTLITLGDLYYGRREYVKAQPNYDEASKILTNENSDYARVAKLAEVLSDLTREYEVVVLQDSLQHLATLPKDKQLKIIEKVIKDKAEAEERAKLQAEQQQRDEGDRFVPLGGPIGANAGKWYFYNPNLIRSGKSDFQRQWGNRKLEDNWRRSNKSTAMFADSSFDAMGDGTETGDIESGDGTAATPAAMDDTKPEYYLRQIPATPEQISRSNAEIADALLNMGAIYKDRLNDLPMAIDTYEDFIRRFRSDERVPDAYFQLYLVETKQQNTAGANAYRTRIINNYPKSKYAQILSQPNYIEQFNRMQKQQDSLYAATYQAYSNNDFRTVVRNTGYAEKNFPLSNLMPKFKFLSALSIGKTDTPQNFETALNEVVETYPQSDVSAMAKDIVALIRQGREAQTGTSHGTLLTRRGDELKAVMEEEGITSEKAFSPEMQGKHRVMLISSAEQQDMYQLMYQVAAFNFTRFMVKEFDLVLNLLDDTQQVLSVTNFESYEEAVWYLNSINSDLTIADWVTRLGIQEVIISEENFALIRILGLDDYLSFQAQHLGKIPAKPTTSRPKETKPKEEEKKKETPVQPERPIAQQPEQKQEEAKQEQQQEVVAVQEPEKKEEVAVVEQPEAAETPVQVQEPEPEPEEELELYKGLFAYQPEKPHFVAVYIMRGSVNFDKFKADVDAYNSQNYGMLNLNISLENVGDQQVIIIGSFNDANIAKSYLMRIVKERELFEGLRGSNYRNLLGTQRNLNVMMQNNALSTYTTFMQEYYLK